MEQNNIELNISFVVIVLIIGYTAIYLLFGNIWGILFVLVITGIIWFYYVLNVNILNLFTHSIKKIDKEIHESASIEETNIQQLALKPQVFNLPGNQYTFGDAKAVCSAFGARLATYSEIEESYNSGGEWCNYGWSDDQMALYPTQTDTYNQLQKIKGHEKDCGRPGINGGFMNNPQLKFGINCYGYKPRMTQMDEYLMANKPIYPKSKQDIDMDNRVKYWKTKLTNLLVSPFNHNTWSRL